jgi:thiol-disulfide isomerase/thioredoxin
MGVTVYIYKDIPLTSEGTMQKNSIISVLLISCLISMASVFANDSDYKPVLIMFSADWCKYCQVAKKDINNDKVLSEVVKNYQVVTADFDVDKDLVEGYDIKSIPSFVTIKGRTVTKKIGYKGPKDLTKFLEENK